MLHMKLEYRSGFLFVVFDGLLNRDNAYKINKYLLPTLLKQKVKNLVLDLTNVLLVDEAGLDALANTKTAIDINSGNIYFNIKNNNIKNELKSLHIKEFVGDHNGY